MTYADVVRADAPLAYYRLKEPAGTTLVDASGNARNGTYTSTGVTYSATGIIATVGPTDAATHFDGTGYGEVAAASWMYGLTSITLECWVRITSDTLAQTGVKTIMGRGATGSNRQAYLTIGASAGTLGFSAGPTSPLGVYVSGISASGYTFALNQTYHLVGNYNGERMELWVNGQLVATGANPGTLPDSTGTSLRIGGTGLSQVAADVDEAAIYDHLLTPVRIRTHYLEGTGTTYTPTTLATEILADSPMVYYKLDETSGTTMADSSANSRNGTYGSTATKGAAGATADGRSALSVDGASTSLGTIAKAAWMDSLTAFSLEAWVKVVTPVSGGTKSYFFSRNSSSPDWGLYVTQRNHSNTTTGAAGMYVRENSATITVTGFTSIDDGNWHHVVGIMDSSKNLYIYVDGILENTGNAVAYPPATNGIEDLLVGGGNVDGATPAFVGSVDEVAMYNTALSAARVKAHYLAGITPAGPTVIHSDTFDRGNSTTVVGTPEIGGPYTVAGGTWGINSNALYTSASSAESIITFPGAADFDARLRWTTMGTDSGLIFRRVDANNQWLLQVLGGANQQVKIHRRVAGGYVQMAPTLGKTLAVTDVLRTVAIGNKIWVFLNETLLWEVEDGFPAGFTSSTMGFRTNSETNSRIADVVVRSAPSSPYADGYGTVVPDTELPMLELATNPISANGYLYKGRDTKLADEGVIP